MVDKKDAQASIPTHAETSDNNMLFAAGLLDRGVLIDINPEVSEMFLKDVDVEALFAVNQKLGRDEDLDNAVKNVRSSLQALNNELVRAAIEQKKLEATGQKKTSPPGKKKTKAGE